MQGHGGACIAPARCQVLGPVAGRRERRGWGRGRAGRPGPRVGFRLETRDRERLRDKVKKIYTKIKIPCKT